MRRLILTGLLIALVVGGGAFYRNLATPSAKKEIFRLTRVSRGDLLVTVGATGTVEPEEVVDVGAQVVGRIKEFGKDPRGKTDPAFAGKSLDYGSPVEKDMLLAQIDPSIYQAQFDQAAAAFAQAEANVLQMEAKLAQTDAEWKRAQRLREIKLVIFSPTGSEYSKQTLPIKGITDADYILAKANFESAKANLQAVKAAVSQFEAALELAKTNLGYTTIPSPVSGTIIDRRMNIGQTVVANLNAVSLFLIARDLRKMQVWASVNEADIGRLHVGTQVHFRVDAFPSDVFRGVVYQIRLNASMTQNVVTYTVVISVDNSDLKLLPYLTADVKFEIDERKNTLLVPNSALRFNPQPEQIVAASEKSQPSVDVRSSPSAALGDARPTTSQRVWVLADGGDKVRAVDVQTGLTDGSLTEILDGELQESDEIVVGERREAAPSDVSNPFGPPKLRGNRPNAKAPK